MSRALKLEIYIYQEGVCNLLFLTWSCWRNFTCWRNSIDILYIYTSAQKYPHMGGSESQPQVLVQVKTSSPTTVQSSSKVKVAVLPGAYPLITPVPDSGSSRWGQPPTELCIKMVKETKVELVL